MNATTPLPNNSPHEGEYEDLLGLWSDLESALSVLLSKPLQVQDFPGKVRAFDLWLQDLVAHDIDAALYLMFQLAATSSVGYSAAHALVCGTLCHIMAQDLRLVPSERDSLVRAALTMNIGMTALQDELAEQRERPTSAQQEAIRSHPEESQALLERLFVSDKLWLDVVGQHHTNMADQVPLAQQNPEDRLTRILGTIDRYAAMISPRKSRAGRSATDSVRAIVGQEVDQRDEVSYTLVRSIGLCPPGTFVRLDNGEVAIVLRR
ncbi:HD-GYP domain-containing protein, partial [Acidovorax sp.]|uniref:HD-GYP domain-containing protein n=1 Tax=Acidovorax sp. TaxID=1872122 RepID=UPI00391F49FB